MTSPSWQGYVEGEFVSVASPFAGRLDKLSVDRGQQVADGAPLFVLESDDERAARQQAAEQVRAAEAQLADIQTGKRPVEVAVTQAQLVAGAGTGPTQRGATPARRSPVRDRRHLQTQLDDSRATADADAARVRELQRDIDVARLPGRRTSLPRRPRRSMPRAALAQAEWKLSRKFVNATVPGLVYDVPFRPGEWVPAGSAVVRMLPPPTSRCASTCPRPWSDR
jgi:HlyD family secretion protein